MNGTVNSAIATGFSTRNLGAETTPFPSKLKPQTVNEFNLGFEYEVQRDLVVGVRGIYRAQGSVIEDGSFDDGNHYFLFNPGETSPAEVVGLIPGLTAQEAQDIIAQGDIFGRARRYYRALEFTATRRFNNNFSFVTSYVFST